ncbi:hypothetical protein M011DRAFT_459791 [Sporormia fimetaria CBS 119925]|uniref:Uncharacterized protein n=1 Tax=Sporormia fimetaria CBS 119925 TaxID=1340428 RepID=A0A6A6V769_9PLEO|nr:hypothetical protein M011DRAFT_459791 [Sporormia fimetaria CBS 119925]
MARRGVINTCFFSPSPFLLHSASSTSCLTSPRPLPSFIKNFYDHANTWLHAVGTAMQPNKGLFVLNSHPLLIIDARRTKTPSLDSFIGVQLNGRFFLQNRGLSESSSTGIGLAWTPPIIKIICTVATLTPLDSMGIRQPSSLQ